MTLRISDLPRAVQVKTDDYLVINVNNKITSSISAYNLAAYMGQFMFDLDLIPDLNIDGGNVVPPGDVIDGGLPGDVPKPGVVVIDGGTPTFGGFGPNIDGGYSTDSPYVPEAGARSYNTDMQFLFGLPVSDVTGSSARPTELQILENTNNANTGSSNTSYY